jgi:hypothetical protein
MDEAKAACAAVRAMNEEDREETNRARAELGVEPLPKGGYESLRSLLAVASTSSRKVRQPP